MLKTKEEIKAWLDRFNIKGYTINDDLIVDVDNSVNLYSAGLKEIPVQFGIVDGYFNCAQNELESLVGCPTKVGEYFNCSYNQLTELNDCPKVVGGHFACRGNHITNISRFTCNFTGDFLHSENPIPGYEAFYETVQGGSNYKVSVLKMKHNELMNVISKVELMKELSHLKSNETTNKKSKI